LVGFVDGFAVEGLGGLRTGWVDPLAGWLVDGLLTEGLVLVEAKAEPPGPSAPAGVVPADGSESPPLTRATVIPAAAIAQVAAIATTALDRPVCGSRISSPSSTRGRSPRQRGTLVDNDQITNPSSSVASGAGEALCQSGSVTDPDASTELARLRGTIDNIDAALVHLLAERFKCTQQVGALKARSGLPPADKTREERQITRLRSMAIDAGLDPVFAEKFLNFIIAEVILHHERIAEAS
jgi:chorismate mutase